METILSDWPGDRTPTSLSNAEQVTIMGGSPFVLPRSQPVTLSVADVPESIGMELRFGSGGLGSVAYPSANLAIFIPFGIPAPVLVAQMYWMNSTPVAGNIDVGVYDTAGNLLVSKGSTAVAGTNNIQLVDVTDTTLPRGRYYFAIASDTANVATQKIEGWTASNVACANLMGVYQMATAFPLPNPATFATMAQTIIPIVGITGSTTL